MELHGDAHGEETPFVVLYDDGTIAIKKPDEISRMYDLADCDAMDGVKKVMAVNQDCELVPVTIGPQVRSASFPDEGIVYAYSEISAGTRAVGYIAHTDH